MTDMFDVPFSLVKGIITGIILVLIMFSFGNLMVSRTFGEGSLWSRVTKTFQDFFSFGKPDDELETKDQWATYENRFVLNDNRGNLMEMLDRIKDCYAIGKAESEIKEEVERVNCSKFCSEIETQNLKEVFYRELGSGYASFPQGNLYTSDETSDIKLIKGKVYQLYTEARPGLPPSPVFVEKTKKTGVNCEDWIKEKKDSN